jgi:hypothetical protein
MPQTVRVPADLTLTTPDGAPARLADRLAGNQFTVVQLVRYFGCLPCQEWLIELDRGRGSAGRARGRRGRGRRLGRLPGSLAA